MLVFGSGSDVKVVKALGEYSCSTCEKPRPFHLVLHYDYYHFYYLFKLVTGETYTKACEICGRGEVVSREEAERINGDKALTAFERFGCLIWFAVLAILIVGTIILGKFMRGEL